MLAYQIPHTANRQKVCWEYAVLSDSLYAPAGPALLPKGESRWMRGGEIDGLAA